MPDTLLPTRLEKLDASNESADKDRFNRLLSIVPYPLSWPFPIVPITAIVVKAPTLLKLTRAESIDIPRTDRLVPTILPSMEVISLFFPFTENSPFTIPDAGVDKFCVNGAISAL